MPLPRLVDNLLDNLIDTALDRSVVGGYGRPGLAVRRRLPGWPADPPRLDGRVVVVTGATAGLGLAAATGFARLGATVHLVGRDPGRTARAVTAVRAQAAGGKVVGELCDVSDLASLERFTAGWRGPLDVLVNNAGVMPPSRQLTADGVELAFATNVLGPFVLVDRLAPHLGTGARVVNVSSGGMYGQRLGADLQNADYRPVRAYARTKRAEVVLTELWADRLSGRGVVVHAMHPGWADTPGVSSSLSTFAKVAGPILRTPEQGADTVVWLGGAPEALAATGLFWHDRRPRPTHLLPRTKETEEDRRRLWDLCVSLSGSSANVH
jgi:NAD(P)-dependent dehydrogenase (short-subunit alcohol dehydrogenase family)